MTSIFMKSVQEPQADPTEKVPIFEKVKEQYEKNIIPPVGIVAPELLEEFQKNIGDEEAIKRSIQEYEDYKKESGFQTIGREAGAHALRGLEGYLGGIDSFLNFLFSGQDLEIEGEKGETLRYRPKEDILPSTQELHEFTKEKTGGFFEPKSEVTKATQEVAADLGSLFSVPGGGGFWSKILSASLGQLGKQSVKVSGGSEGAQELAKNGIMVLSSMARIGNAPQVASKAFRDAENMLPRGIVFSSQPTEKALGKLKNTEWYKSGITTSKAPAFAEIERIENQISNNQIDAYMAMQIRRDINEAKMKAGAWGSEVPDKKAALYYLNEVDKSLLASMENYGKKVDPQWWKQYQRANEAFRITQRSRLLSDFLEKNAKPLKSETAKILFHVGSLEALAKAPLLGGIALPTAATIKGIQITNRMIKSPILRNHYIKVLQAAAAENSAVMNKALQAFDKAALEEEKKSNSIHHLRRPLSKNNSQ